jgi:DNA polymerase-3 subunit epsilon
MREIVLDTETTGLSPSSGHRVVEIAAIELVNRMPTERRFQTYINPERDMPEEAFRVHGLSTDFLAGHPTFAEVADAFLDFVSDDVLVIHNAEFDLGFLNAEMARLERPALAPRQVVDTVMLAREKFPGAPASLDALCRRFSIDNSRRTVHGAMLDSELLAEVYLELMGGRQPDLSLAAGKTSAAPTESVPRTERPPRPHIPSEAELATHESFVDALKDPVWKK